ncbi:MAG: hypothetical protein GKR89_24510 [Candidatus Latescibacteria bacterium]|nr:hypothetical protein [Candidatus Latescibacterota bacterium]
MATPASINPLYRMRTNIVKLKLILLVCAATAMTSLPLRAQVGHNDQVLNPNRASQKALLQLDQLDSTRVATLVAGRPYLSMVQLDTTLTDLPEAAKKALYPHLFLPINLNTAAEGEILLVPGVGERMAHEFEEYRPYKNLQQFRREIGKYVDENEIARLEQYVFVPINLNTAAEADILSIPGVGKRLAHEFEEYRPYKNIEQFRREIGKYVDENEVARLERYVILD